jgi:hypothetical protein
LVSAAIQELIYATRVSLFTPPAGVESKGDEFTGTLKKFGVVLEPENLSEEAFARFRLPLTREAFRTNSDTKTT